MSAAPQMGRQASEAGPQLRPPTSRRVDARAPGGGVWLHVTRWLSRAGWTIGRTGRTGLAGIGLLLAAAVFLLSTQLRVADEVETLRADVARARQRERAGRLEKAAEPPAPLLDLPPRSDMPEILRQLFSHARQSRLSVDSGKYEIDATRSIGVVRHLIAIPVTGSYPDIRAFIDATLSTMPSLALSDLVLERRTIADGSVAAEFRMTVFTSASDTPPAAAAGIWSPAGPEAPRATAEVCPAQASERVVVPTNAGALFAQHSWYVLPLAPVPVPVKPPEPTAPPFPYSLIGSYAPTGEPPVFFLAKGDQVIDARVGDHIDGVYQFESASGGQLVFVYLPLNVRHNLASGGSP